MSSFYGNSGASVEQVEQKVDAGTQEAKNHIIVSKTQPIIQKTGDLWFVIVSDDDEE